MKFFDPLDKDLKQSVLEQIRDAWTHHSTAIEGNTLSLEETHFILNEGLTVKGKPIHDHNEVIGHAKAIDLLYSLLNKDICIKDLFTLHTAIQGEVMLDIMQPNGAWKRETNGTNSVNKDGEQVFIEFSTPQSVPGLMQQWLAALNEISLSQSSIDLLNDYARLHAGFTAIHPFWDGNGRMARLLCNLPLLKAGYPPLVISNDSRQDYIHALNQYSFATTQPTLETGVWPEVRPGIAAGKNESDSTPLSVLTRFCLSQYQSTQDIIDNARQIQVTRTSEAT